MKMIVIGNRRSWWSQAVRGFIALLFGLGAIVWPHLTLIALVFLFGAFVLLDGILAAIAALVERRLYRHWWIILLAACRRDKPSSLYQR